MLPGSSLILTRIAPVRNYIGKFFRETPLLTYMLWCQMCIRDRSQPAPGCVEVAGGGAVCSGSGDCHYPLFQIADQQFVPTVTVKIHPPQIRHAGTSLSLIHIFPEHHRCDTARHRVHRPH